MAGLSTGPPLMIIIFYIDHFSQYGGNREILTIGVLLFLIILIYVGYRSLVRVRFSKRSGYYSKKYSQRQQNILFNSKIGDFTEIQLKESNLGNQKKTFKKKATNFDNIIDRTLAMSLVVQDSLESEIDVEEACVLCCKNVQDTMLLPCRHAQFCEYCVKEMTREGGRNVCEICKQSISRFIRFKISIN